jgi:hypothetical protein
LFAAALTFLSGIISEESSPLSQNYQEAVRSRPEMLGSLPYLLGHHPADDLVAVFLDTDRIIAAASRLDLSAPPVLAVQQWAQAATQMSAAAVILVGYGSSKKQDGGRVSAVADALGAHAPVRDVLLVADGQYFCLRCPCPAAAGVPFDPTTTAVAARATLAGRVALASRDELLALADPDPAEQAAVDAELAQLPVETDEPGAVVRYLMDLAEQGQRLTAAEVARLVHLLTDVVVRDAAWQATRDVMWQRDLWLDVTRRTPPEFVAAPASLAAWCAWQRGEHVLAAAAVRRALAARPGYLLARLIAQALHAGIPAHQLRTAIPGPSAGGLGERP